LAAVKAIQLGNQQMYSWVTRIAAGIAVLIALILPLGYFALAYQLHVALAEQLIAVNAEQISALAGENPELWMYQFPRIEDLLSRHKGSGSGDIHTRTVFDAGGSILVRVGQPPPFPAHRHSMPVYESGQIVGRIEILDSLHKELDGTAIAALLGLLLGGGVYATLRILPLRALQRATRALLGQQQRFIAAIESAADGYALLDSQGAVLEVNQALCMLTGYPRQKLLGMPFAALEAESPPADFLARAVAIQHVRLETRWKRQDGSIIDVEVTATCPSRENEEIFCFCRDITEKKASAALIWKQANFDMLTQLPNRSMLNDRLAQEIKKAHRAGLHLALLFIDLDHFKEVNDRLGHAMGDLLLVETARRIGACVRETDTVARLSGDEFTVLLAGLGESEIVTVERVAQQILEQLSAPFTLLNQHAEVSASIGITFYPGDADSIEDLFKNADQAMYAAKNQGRNRYCYFTPAARACSQSIDVCER